jgi:hypothetical protein
MVVLERGALLMARARLPCFQCAPHPPSSSPQVHGIFVVVSWTEQERTVEESREIPLDRRGYLRRVVPVAARGR